MHAMKKSINERDDLASYPHISTLLYQVLSVAQAGGMTEVRATEIYDEIHSHFVNIQGEAFWPLRDDLIRILVTPDESYESSEGGGFSCSDRFS